MDNVEFENLCNEIVFVKSKIEALRLFGETRDAPDAKLVIGGVSIDVEYEDIKYLLSKEFGRLNDYIWTLREEVDKILSGDFANSYELFLSDVKAS